MLARLRNHTWTGLRLMVIGFLLSWIPVISYVGALLLLMGVAFLWFGRRAFSGAHRPWVARGTVVLAVGLAGLLVVEIFFQLAAGSLTAQAGQSVAAALATFRWDLAFLVVGSFVFTTVCAFGFVALPYGRADGVARGILWSGFGAALVLALVEFSTFWNEFSAVIASAQAGSWDPTPIMNVSAQLLWFGILQVVPYSLFAWGYLRVRSRLFPGGKKAAQASIYQDVRIG